MKHLIWMGELGWNLGRTGAGAVGYLCLLLMAICRQALAQGCAMCKVAAESQEASAAQALNTGILVLLFPPLLILSAIVFMAVWSENNP